MSATCIFIHSFIPFTVHVLPLIPNFISVPLLHILGGAGLLAPKQVDGEKEAGSRGMKKTQAVAAPHEVSSSLSKAVDTSRGPMWQAAVQQLPPGEPPGRGERGQVRPLISVSELFKISST